MLIIELALLNVKESLETDAILIIKKVEIKFRL